MELLRSYHEIIKSKFTDRPYFPLIRDTLPSVLLVGAGKRDENMFLWQPFLHDISWIFCLFKSTRLWQIISWTSCKLDNTMYRLYLTNSYLKLQYDSWIHFIFQINGGLSRHVPYSQRGGRCGHSPSAQNIELKTSSRILRESPIAQNSDYYPYPSSIKSAPAQTSNLDEPKIYNRGETLNNQMSNVRTSLQGHNDGYRNGHFSI